MNIGLTMVFRLNGGWTNRLEKRFVANDKYNGVVWPGSPYKQKEVCIMSDILVFANREEFRKWLHEHCLSNDGGWLLFGKAAGDGGQTR